MSESRCCCNCRHNIRTDKGTHFVCNCDIDGHYISYVANFEGWCRRWAKDKKFESVQESHKLEVENELV